MDGIGLLQLSTIIFVGAALREVVRVLAIKLGELLERIVAVMEFIAGDLLEQPTSNDLVALLLRSRTP